MINYKEIEKDFELVKGEIKSGDVILFKTHNIMSNDSINKVKGYIHSILMKYNIDCPIIVLEHDSKIEILRNINND